MIEPGQLIALAAAMRGHGVRRLKTSDIEIELGPPPAPPPQKFNLEQQEEDEAAQRKRLKGYVYGSSY